MSIEHKAFAFDWASFEQTLFPILTRALETGDVHELITFIDQNRAALTDPYEGMPLDDNWQNMLSNRDAHEYGDFALTMYYDPAAPCGLAYDWMALSDRLPARVNQALLGEVLGPEHNRFDPGRMGSYFQRLEQVRTSLEILNGENIPEMDEFRSLLTRCAASNQGVYITF